MERLRKLGVLGFPLVAWALLGCTSERAAVSPSAGQSATPADQSPRVSRSQQPEGMPLAVPTSARVQIPKMPGAPVPSRVRICAHINGTPIFLNELLNGSAYDLSKIQELSEPERSTRREKILKDNLQHLIDQEVVYQEAYRKFSKHGPVFDKLKEAAHKQFRNQVARNLEKYNLTDAEYKKVLLQQGQSYEALRRTEEKKFIVGEFIRYLILPITDQIGHEDILDYYKAHLNEFQTVEHVEWQDIFIAAGNPKRPTLEHARQFGRELVARLERGEPFANFIQFDDGDSVTRKGQGNGQRRGEIRPAELEQYLFQMKAGQVGPVVELTTGVHVFRLVKREEAGQLPFNSDVQTKIRNKLQNEMFQREFQRLVRQLASRTVIEVDPESLK